MRWLICRRTLLCPKAPMCSMLVAAWAMACRPCVVVYPQAELHGMEWSWPSSSALRVALPLGPRHPGRYLESELGQL